MRYFVLLMALVLSSCSHDIRVNDGWVIYDLRPLDGGCIMYYGKDGRFSIFNSNKFMKFVGYQGEYNAPVVGYIMNGVGLVFTDRVHFL